MSKIIVIIFLSLVPIQLWAQILPKEGCSLNYRVIGFSFPEKHHANSYKLEIALGAYYTEDSFKRKIVISDSSENTKIIHDVPSFGKQYTWRVIYRNRNKAIEKSPLYHFNIKINQHADTSFFRLRIMQPAPAEYKYFYVSVNFGGVLYDMTGNPVWFIPDTNGVGGIVNDLKFTSDSTVTFFYGPPVEINLNGDVLWRAPKYEVLGTDTNHIRFHHELVKLSNGHYMVLGLQMLMCKSVVSGDSTYILTSKDMNIKDGYKRGKFGTILEYDEKGNQVWSWRSGNYLPGSDYDYFSPADTNIKFDPHDNAFYFDEKDNVIYLCFRNLNRIMKIEYPSGKILDIYGDNFKKGITHQGSGLFCNPHAIKYAPGGILYYFENNSCNNTDSLPEVVILKEPVSEQDSLKVIWRFTCPVEGDVRLRFMSGGNVELLPDSSLFVCMGSDYSKFFIVNRKKEILWSALPETYIPNERKWRVHKQDRSSIISRKDFEKLVWKVENAK